MPRCGFGRAVKVKQEDLERTKWRRAQSAASARRIMQSNVEAWSPEVMVDWSLSRGTGDGQRLKVAMGFNEEEKKGYRE